MIYRNVWIPSQQRFIKFKELTTIQYKNILKCMDDGFVDILNEVVLDNAKEKIQLSKLTALDRFIILLYLKIYSCGAIMEFHNKCIHCNTENTHRINLNDLLDLLGSRVDEDFKRIINIQSGFSVQLDIPSIEYFDNIVKSDELTVDDYLYMFIHSLHIADRSVIMSELNDSDRNDYYSLIPYQIYNDIKSYSENIRTLFSDIRLFDVVCSNPRCKSVDTVDFTLEALNRNCKHLFLDDSFDNVIAFMGGFGEKFHVDYKFYTEMTPLELNLMYNAEKAQSDLPPVEENDDDLFAQYRNQTKTMVETPSEFK